MPGFNIVVRYFGTTTPTANQQAAFAAAQAKWEALIFGDLDDAGPINYGVGTACGPNYPDLPAITNETIDDLVIYAKVDSIDGPGGVLGSAGPCLIRTSGGTPGLPALGVMRFDAADLANLEASGELNLVILHEMGHVLGYGTLWTYSTFGLLANACGGANPCTTDPHFTGTRAIGAFDDLGGAGYSAGAKVPVENSGGAGTQDGHWRESVLDNELMTGYLNSGRPNPLSTLSVASLLDMGYQVDYSAADAFTITLALRAGVSTGRTIHLVEDLHGPIYEIDASGHISRVVRQ
jgi:hypothetical protein